MRAESPPTERYQATVPQPVRQALGLRKRDPIRYTVRANGEVVLQRVNAEPADDDPALAPFLALLEQDIASHPERLQPVTAEQTWVDAGLHEAEHEMHEQHRVTVVVEPGIYQHAFQALACEGRHGG